MGVAFLQAAKNRVAVESYERAVESVIRALRFLVSIRHRHQVHVSHFIILLARLPLRKQEPNSPFRGFCPLRCCSLCFILANNPLALSSLQSSSLTKSPLIPFINTLPKNSNLTKQPSSLRIQSESQKTSSPTIGPPPPSSDPIQKLLQRDYKWGFTSDIDSFFLPKGLSESTIHSISAIKFEPDWMLEFRLNAYCGFLAMPERKWSDNTYPPINFQAMLCFFFFLWL